MFKTLILYSKTPFLIDFNINRKKTVRMEILRTNSDQISTVPNAKGAKNIIKVRSMDIGLFNCGI